MKNLDAYGHLTWAAGWSDEWNEEVPEDSDRGDMLVAADAVRDGDNVRYHLVVNTDSGGFIETQEQGSVPAAEAVDLLTDLFENAVATCVELNLLAAGQDLTPNERKENDAVFAAWRQHLEAITTTPETEAP